jgi:hypothetical protein
MRNLLIKEFKLSINKFFYILPILLAALLLIPNWLFLFVPMYFFWISVPQIYAGYLAQQDYSFTVMLPVTKSNVVRSKAYSLMLLELYHFGLILVFGLIHNMIYDYPNIFVDLGPQYFGYVLLLFGLFNILFLPQYFKSAYYFGKPLILGVVVTLIVGVGLDLLPLIVTSTRELINPETVGMQYVYFLICAVIFITFSWLSVKLSIKNYGQIK